MSSLCPHCVQAPFYCKNKTSKTFWEAYSLTLHTCKLPDNPRPATFFPRRKSEIPLMLSLKRSTLFSQLVLDHPYIPHLAILHILFRVELLELIPVSTLTEAYNSKLEPNNRQTSPNQRFWVPMLPNMQGFRLWENMQSPQTGWGDKGNWVKTCVDWPWIILSCSSPEPPLPSATLIVYDW